MNTPYGFEYFMKYGGGTTKECSCSIKETIKAKQRFIQGDRAINNLRRWIQQDKEKK